VKKSLRLKRIMVHLLIRPFSIATEEGIRSDLRLELEIGIERIPTSITPAEQITFKGEPYGFDG